MYKKRYKFWKFCLLLSIVIGFFFVADKYKDNQEHYSICLKTINASFIEENLLESQYFTLDTKVNDFTDVIIADKSEIVNEDFERIGEYTSPIIMLTNKNYVLEDLECIYKSTSPNSQRDTYGIDTKEFFEFFLKDTEKPLSTNAKVYTLSPKSPYFPYIREFIAKNLNNDYKKTDKVIAQFEFIDNFSDFINSNTATTKIVICPEFLLTSIDEGFIPIYPTTTVELEYNLWISNRLDEESKKTTFDYFISHNAAEFLGLRAIGRDYQMNMISTMKCAKELVNIESADLSQLIPNYETLKKEEVKTEEDVYRESVIVALVCVLIGIAYVAFIYKFPICGLVVSICFILCFILYLV